MAEGMVEIAIIKSIGSFVSRTFKAYRRGIEPRVSKTLFPIPNHIKAILKAIVIHCKDENIFSELDALIQQKDRVKMLEDAHLETFGDFDSEFTPMKFLRVSAVCFVVAAELEAKGFAKAVSLTETHVSRVYMEFREHDVFKQLGFRLE